MQSKKSQFVHRKKEVPLSVVQLGFYFLFIEIACSKVIFLQN
ncbi:hypothetical protein J2S11_000954 [Bacillus horti]|uniref:Uncharacterized protein n=1 Tax=Caldalkalibacillus horti TaxID=77523 RepID=A0ABT9VVM6_9BACI|nr:hypothetical protein [Bacillus horti]